MTYALFFVVGALSSAAGFYIGFARGTHHGFILGRMQGIRMIRDGLMDFGVIVGILSTPKGQLTGLTVDRVPTEARQRGEG